jgi:hypothetical protein
MSADVQSVIGSGWIDGVAAPRAKPMNEQRPIATARNRAVVAEEARHRAVVADERTAERLALRFQTRGSTWADVAGGFAVALAVAVSAGFAWSLL